MPDDLLIIATLIKKLSHDDLRTFATLLAESVTDDDDFDSENADHFTKLLNDWATTQIEADD